MADSANDERKQAYSLRFQAIEPETSEPAANTPYVVTRADGSEINGVTDQDGMTDVITASEPEKVGVHFIFVSPLGKPITREELA